MPPLNVLVVDDDTASLAAIEAAVVSFGHDCRVAKDGLEAWQMHQSKAADVIVSDWDMPRMDGLELCRRTRVADDDRVYTYFIFMTSFGDKAHFLRGMDAGADDYQTKPIDLDELQARLWSAQRVVSLYRRLADKNKVLRRDSQTSFQLARVDALTGVANRLGLDEALESLWARADRYGHRYSVALCDIDWFKAYNDHFGHLAGDAALQAVAKALQRELRRGDSLFRYGGEEFLAVLPEQSAAAAGRAAERMRRTIESLGLRTPAGSGVVTISVGVAELERSDETIADWLNRADHALYSAKASGRNRVAAAASDLLDHPLSRRQQLTNDR
jgi:two-component system chemotaxis response regulator CheY